MIEDIDVGGLPGRALLPHQSLDRPTIDRVARRRDQTLLHRRGGIEAQDGRRAVAVTPPDARSIGPGIHGNGRPDPTLPAALTAVEPREHRDLLLLPAFDNAATLAVQHSPKTVVSGNGV